MVKQLSWKVGGQQGEGIDSAGEILSTALNRKGYYLYGYRHFSSRIKGGHSNTKIRISINPIRSISDELDILVAFDQESIDLNAHELVVGGVILADAKFNPTVPEGVNANLLAIPFTKIAEEIGMSQMKNMVAVGASAALLGIPADAFKEVIEERFARKGQKVVDRNMEAITRGFEHAEGELGDGITRFRLEPSDGKKRLYMIGNDAIALGAIAAGARLMAAYPITPSSEIMEYLIKKLPKFGGSVVQTEDELAAITMVIGANYGGVRALTASAGPGLSLMTEAIGLAGMTETPAVIVNTQRGGPSTGLPTKQEQSDLLSMLFSTHGEIPKIVIAPSTAEECFYDTIQAFNLAEQYQCPVIILSDLAMSLGKQTVEPLEYDRIEIKRGKLVSWDEELPELEPSQLFLRYELTEDGISRRVLPGQKNGLHHVTGVEHDETGRPSEKPLNRKKMMEKRLMKLKNGIDFDTPVYLDAPHDDADLLVIGFNSTRGTISEAKERAEAEGLKINHAHIRQLLPFPTEIIREQMNRAKKVLVVENNATGQLTNVIKMYVGMAEKLVHFGKYDGNPFLPSEIYHQCKELLVHGHV
ncbi:2-oxoacid:acceptor oxidoreductase subunit alpha [Thermoactinomyces vulgaris]|uniref:2-oxoacid:acceptor oxidoreductase subunit alpha n=1 Tax=Thermoactinomyces vulgaris TaxID=2026 RepID=A0ABS0QJV0_THEVU|nr:MULTISPECIES: 2-oxoacid:acceptor oxidoreductase subunit alpha [Thermoactinomyces]KFZ39896.1 2-oxoglutarate ferredoxin oxidoreductase subunit alpha [Thermoactinomyces sp. Gus2-1]MBA4552304.1 2-oxoacid:acceptor oxidoreductase subunit alpha [Thermoactinomyces vulgaris]MBA4597269.1 2-oxoacid:acceptor oxidoreductase subunit alpha [Thermoactinomyces vulgaris]MBH8582590.1 2-oxoacid:acceptor oxidoreductase subunit alpha [Thermoactinomyces sp. CICC 10735]MBH8589248.1 2-oxoacid:acceptor oxidoreductas